MKKLLIIPVIIATTLASCDNSSESKDEANKEGQSTEEIKEELPDTLPPLDDNSGSVAFEDFLHRFIGEFELDSASVAKFAHPKMGIYLFDNPGAFHAATHTADYSFMNEREWSEEFDCLPEHAEIPVFSCENNSWSNEGCYYDVQDAAVVTPLLELMVEYELTDSFDEDRAGEFDSAIEYELRATDQFVGYYFGRIEGKWYLMVIDLIVPCSA